MPSLVDRLAALREKEIALENKDPRSELAATPTPLSTFLYIFNRAGPLTGLYNYLPTINALVAWLAPIEIPTIEDSDLPTYIPSLVSPPLLHDLAVAIRPTIPCEDIMQLSARHNRIKRTIVYLTLKEVLR